MELEDFTIFDIFVKKTDLYMILSINNLPVHENEICIKYENQILIPKDKLEKDLYEPILIFVYDFSNNSNNSNTNFVTITYKKNNYNYFFGVCPQKNKKKIALTTLFKYDIFSFPFFYEYYKNQGVEDFYIYYNGKLSDLNQDVFSNKKNVCLIEWNFRYINPEKYKYMHHAQLGQIHHSLYKFGKDYYDYMIFCDFDEYFHIKDQKICDLITNNPTIDKFVFNNYWCNTLDNRIPKTIDDMKTVICTKHKEELYNYPLFISSPQGVTNINRQFYGRTKNIFKLDHLLLLGVHVDISWNKIPEVLETDLFMLHFYKWSGNKRENPSIKELEDRKYFLYNLF